MRMQAGLQSRCRNRSWSWSESVILARVEVEARVGKILLTVPESQVMFCQQTIILAERLSVLQKALKYRKRGD